MCNCPTTWEGKTLPVYVECAESWVAECGDPDLVRVSRQNEGSYIVRRENLPQVLNYLSGPIPDPKLTR